MRAVAAAMGIAAVVAAVAIFAATSAGGAASVVSAAQTCHSRGGLPDAHCTPGAIDPRVTQSDIDATICRRGYTRTVRPPESYTEPLKLRQMAAYGYYAGRRPSAYEEDHLIPLELGGSPRSARNLWPEAHAPRPGSYQKDAVENRLRREVCDGRISLARARHLIAVDWVSVYAHPSAAFR